LKSVANITIFIKEYKKLERGKRSFTLNQPRSMWFSRVFGSVERSLLVQLFLPILDHRILDNKLVKQTNEAIGLK
jgi:hypothetical protein